MVVKIPERADRTATIALATIFAVSAYLVLYNLDQAHFWDDEAHVAIVATNLLEQGRMTGWDGRNLYAYRNGSLLDENLRPRNPPLDYLVAAGGFAAFGRSTWAGRLPFALAGLLSLGVLALLARRAAPRHPWFACAVVGCIGLHPLFVLNARQCRYNALCLLFAVTAYFAYESYFRSDRRHPAWLGLLCGSSILLFYAHFLMAGAFLLGLGAVFLVFHASRASKRDWLGLVATAVVFLVATVPYSVHHRVWVRPDMDVTEPWLRQHLLLVAWNLRDLNFCGMLPWTVGAAAFVAIRRSRREGPYGLAARTLVLGLAYTLVLALVSPQPTIYGGRADLRYLVAAIPLLAIPVGLVPWVLGRWSVWAGASLAMVLVLCNACSMMPGLSKFRWWLPAYVQEVHGPNPTAIGEAAAFLREHAAPEDLVYAYPEENSYPLLFYCGDQLRLGCLLNRDTPLPPEVVDKLDAPLRLEENFPKWFVLFGGHSGGRERMAYFSRPHVEGGIAWQYRYELRETIPRFWFATHRPELSHHTFGPHEPRPGQGVYVFERELVDGTSENE